MRRCWILAVAVAVASGCGDARELSPIHLVPMITLGSDSGDGAMATTPAVGARHLGGFRVVVVARGAIGSLPLVFGDDGRFLGTLRADSTPAGIMYEPIFARSGPGDSTWVFDIARRVHVFDSSRRYVRTSPLFPSPDSSSPLFDAVILPDGRIAATTGTGGLIQLLNADGSLDRTIGTAVAGKTPADVRRIALAPDGSLWTMLQDGSTIVEHWDTTGKLLGTLTLNAPAGLGDSAAIERSGSAPNPSSGRPPQPQPVSIWFDAAGRLWISWTVADRHWRQGIVGGESAAKRHIEADKYFDTIVEMRDPATGDLIATARFDVDCGQVAEPGVLVHQLVTPAGWVRAELLRIVVDETVLHKRK